MNWTSINERLPEVGEYVLGCTPMGIFCYLLAVDKRGDFYGYGFPEKETRITHWMPKPELPIANDR